MEVAAAVGAVTAASSAYLTYKGKKDQRKQIKENNRLANEAYHLDRKQAQLTLAEQQRQNKNLLKQQQSAYKARLGAGGLSDKSGTGQVVLDTLQREHDIDDKFLVNQANISLEALLNGIEKTRTNNLFNARRLSNQNKQSMLNSADSISSGLNRSLLK